MDHLPFTAYLSYDRSSLLNRLAIVTADLAGRHNDAAMSRAEEARAKVGSYFASQESSHSIREMVARRDALSFTTTAIEAEGDVAALTEEKWFLVRLIDEDDK